MSTSTPSSDASLVLLEKHKKRVEQLSARQTRVQYQLEQAREEYAKAVEEAKASYGTADLDQLRALLAEKVAANNKAVEEYIQAIDQFEAHIERIERALADPVALEEMLQSIPQGAEPEQDNSTSDAASEPSGETAAQPVEFDDEDI